MWNFWDLINIEEFKKREDFNSDRWEISFFCKDCKEIVETKRSKKNPYIFNCKKCNGKHIALWTIESLKSKYQKVLKK
jgi:predicted SprT family Zn-dependent metalloprotease